VDLSALAHGVAERLCEAEPQRAISFRIEPGLMARGDGRLLEIALTNLLGNAAKFTQGRAVPRIEFGQTSRPEAPGRPVYFVRDNGAGFDMRYVGKLFGAFQRLHRSSEFPGSGIGLATVRRILQRHGGQVWAEGVLGEGATFYFALGSESP